MTTLEAPRAGELRGQMRKWRRGRAELNYWELFHDAYIALFSVVMVGSMAGNVVLGLRRARGAVPAARAPGRPLADLAGHGLAVDPARAGGR